MGWRVRRPVAALILLVVVAATAATAYRNEITDAGYVAVEESPCYPCHVTWSPPLKDVATIVPPTDTEAALGTRFEYVVRVQNAWLNELQKFEPSIDISNAPSLGFVTETDPILDHILEGVIPFTFDPEDPTGELPISDRSSFVLINVEAGVTDIKITLTPQNQDPALGPDLNMYIYTGTTEPGTSTSRADGQAEDGGAGGSEVYHLIGGSEISELGFGTWVVQAVQKPITGNPSPGAFTDTHYTVEVDTYYNATGETIQFLSREEIVPPGGSTAFTWNLIARGVPEEGESVQVAFNITSYYEHQDSSTEDVAYTHKSVEVPVAACPQGVCFGQSTIIVETPDVGVSMSRVSEVVGYISAFLVLASVYTGGIFGKASRRQLNGVFQSAKRRVAFHNFLSYGIILAATVHTVIFLWPLPNIEGNYHWTQGIIWGTVSILAMFALGVTGALQVPMIRRWNYAVWRWSHLGTTIAVLVFTVVHILLDGGNFGEVQDAVGWTNPLDPRV